MMKKYIALLIFAVAGLGAQAQSDPSLVNQATNTPANGQLEKNHFKEEPQYHMEVREKREGKNVISIFYDMSFPTGDMTNTISENSYEGFTFDYRHFVNDNVALGVVTGRNYYSQHYERDTYPIENGTVTGERWESIKVIPVMLSAYYYFDTNTFIEPYVGMQIGAGSIHQQTEIGYTSVYDQKWSFGFAPEFGIYIPLNEADNFGFIAKGQYNYYMYDQNKIGDLTGWQCGLGLSFKF